MSMFLVYNHNNGLFGEIYFPNTHTLYLMINIFRVHDESMKNNQETTTKGLKSKQTYLFCFYTSFVYVERRNLYVRSNTKPQHHRLFLSCIFGILYFFRIRNLAASTQMSPNLNNYDDNENV